MSLKCYNYDIVFQEIPSEVSLALNISGCPVHCPGCHSQHLWEDVGENLDESLLDLLIEKYDGDITCVCFMGGDGDPVEVERLCGYVRRAYPMLRTAWWSGRNEMPEREDLYDYVKLGPYIESLGGLKSKTTNQALWRREGDCWTKVDFAKSPLG